MHPVVVFVYCLSRRKSSMRLWSRRHLLGKRVIRRIRTISRVSDFPHFQPFHHLYCLSTTLAKWSVLKNGRDFKNCHYYYINAILGRLQIELAKIKRVKWHLEYWNGLFGIHNRLEIIFLHIGNRLTFPQIALVINDSSKFSNTLSDLSATISRWTHYRYLTSTYPCGNISFPVFRLINTLKEIKQNQDQEAITVTGKLNVFITFLIKIIIDSEFSFPELSPVHRSVSYGIVKNQYQ